MLVASAVIAARRPPRRSAARGPRRCARRRNVDDLVAVARARSRRAGSRASGCSTTRSRPAGPAAPRARSRCHQRCAERWYSRNEPSSRRTNRSQSCAIMSRRIVVRARAERAAQPGDAGRVDAERARRARASSATSASRAASRRSRSLFHSIWYAVRIGTRSSMSDADAMNTASVSPPSQRSGRRRPRVRTTCQRSTGVAGVRRTARCAGRARCGGSAACSRAGAPREYANAARSGSASSAPRCRLEREYRCASSNARTRTSPLDRSSE